MVIMMTEQATISKYQAFKIELSTVENELKNPNITYELYIHLKKKQELLQKKLDEMSLFEIWYDFFDGTMANSNGYQERVEVYKDKKKALQRIDELNGDDREKPYYLKVIELNE